MGKFLSFSGLAFDRDFSSRVFVVRVISVIFRLVYRVLEFFRVVNNIMINII